MKCSPKFVSIAAAGFLMATSIVMMSCNKDQNEFEVDNLISTSVPIGEVQGNNYVVVANQVTLLDAFKAVSEDEGIHANYTNLWIAESNVHGEPVKYALYARTTSGTVVTAAARLVRASNVFYLSSDANGTITCTSTCSSGCDPTEGSGGNWNCSACSQLKTCTKTATKNIQ